MNATSSLGEAPEYEVIQDRVFRIREDGTYEPVARPKPVKAGVVLSPLEIEVRRGYWGARRQFFSGSTN